MVLQLGLVDYRRWLASGGRMLFYLGQSRTNTNSTKCVCVYEGIKTLDTLGLRWQ